MEKQHRSKSKNKRNRDDDFSSTIFTTSYEHQLLTIFPLILASLPNLHHRFPRTLLRNCLNRLHQQLLLKEPLYDTATPPSSSAAFISLLPSLLRTTAYEYPAIAQASAEIVGATALFSLDANDAVSSDSEVLMALLDALECWRKKLKVSVAACNAVLDISTASLGRRRLCDCSAVEKLMAVFLCCAASPPNYATWYSMGKGSTVGSGEGMMGTEFPALVLDATITLINSCNLSQLEVIPRNVSAPFLSYLKELWMQVRDKSLQENVAQYWPGRNQDNSRMHDLAESIFRLSILGYYTINSTIEMVDRNVFGPNNSDLEDFMFNYWEFSPFLLKNSSKPLEDHNHLFGALFQSFIPNRTVVAVLSSILMGLVSCPLLPSDELDILNFLKEMKDELGSPICYGQDIRLVKTEEMSSGTGQGNLKREVHFPNECAGSSYPTGSDFLSKVSVQRCKEAFQEGYTIALRGMEFRSEIVAAVSDKLALMFGQPSVGANAYLTPPKSQGLVRHYDDHCVFVCQLVGQKKWRVFPPSTLILPRLYETCESLVHSGSDDTVASGCNEFLLREGDILYIPRGCPHEAFTIVDDNGFAMDSAPVGFSLHLTFGIEVEPPFEWEGFAHAALYSWSQNQLQPPSQTLDGSLCCMLDALSINLLHVGIQLIGSYDPIFRKACMVAGISSPSLDQSKISTFRCMIDKIDKEVGFTKTFECVELAIQAKREDLFQRMRWLRHIHEEADLPHLIDWNSPLTGFENLFLLCNEHRSDLEAAFTKAKSTFCKDVVFESACECFSILLQKYTIIRKQYTNGMLSLHCS